MGDEAITESGDQGLSAVEQAAFNDTTPIEETFDDGNENENEEESFEEEIPNEEEEIEEHLEDEDEITPATFTDLEAANKHIAKQNRENARRRVEVKAYEEVFGKYDPQSKARLLEIVDELATSPENGARTLLQIAKNILGEDALKEPEFDPDQPMTYAQYQELQRQEASAKEQARLAEKQREEDENAVKAIFTQAEELGYKDANTDRHLLLSVAAATVENGGTAGDLNKAHEKVQQFKQAIIDEYINGKSTQRDAFPVTGEGAQPGNTGNAPKDWNDFIEQATEMGNAAMNVGK